MTRIELTSLFEAPLERVWEEANTSCLLHYITRGRIRFKPIDPPAFPEIWSEGDYKTGMLGLGFIPLGWQMIRIEKQILEDGRRVLRDNGYGATVKKWDHWIFLERIDDQTTRYTDRLDLDAGLLTPLLAPIARDFYRHRQKRWQKLIAAGFDYGSG